MKRILFLLTVFILTGCEQKQKYSEQEKSQITQEAYKTLRQSEALLDSITEVTNKVKQRTHYSYTVTMNEALIKSLKEYKDSLYMAINEVEPNYDSIQIKVKDFEYEHLAAKQLMKEFDNKPKS